MHLKYVSFRFRQLILAPRREYETSGRKGAMKAARPGGKRTETEHREKAVLCRPKAK